MARWLKANEVMKEFQISRPTLKVWKDNKKLAYKKLSDKLYLYDVDSINKTNLSSENNKYVIYARVSSLKQKEDLNRQISLLKEYSLKNGHKIDEVFEDIGSGMSSDRKGLNQLLTSIFKKEINTIYISFKDRLSRFGYNYFENICSKFGTKIEVLDDDNFRNKDMEKELTDDLIAIIHYYSMKVYNGRRKKFNKIKKELAKNEIDQSK